MNFRSPAWKRFRANRRGWWSLWLFVALYAASLCAGLFCGSPHEVFPASVLDPHLRPAVVSAGHYPVAAVEVAPAGDVVRAWGDTNLFSSALSSPLPDALAPALAARLRGESAPAFEFATNGVSYRLPPAAPDGGRTVERSHGHTVRVYLRRADWRTAAPEKDAGAATQAPLEPAVFPFRPIPGHPFGFDAAGRDVFSRVVYGTRTAVTFGLLLTLASLTLGIAFGAVQGYFVRWVDIAGQRFTEVWSAIPFLYVMIFLGNAFGRSFGLLLACYAIFNWIGVASYVRAEFLRLRTRPFVDAARVQGYKTLVPFFLMGSNTTI
jgi:ABC-type dipeptide/oligopeptide/nickel transport system permease subunit